MEPITVNLPPIVYEHLKSKAEKTARSVEAELLDVLVNAIPLDEVLPDDMSKELASLSLLNDEALWDEAHRCLPAETANRLEMLHFKRQREGLSDDENQVLPALIRAYEAMMLRRAHAALLLKERGYDVDSLLQTIG